MNKKPICTFQQLSWWITHLRTRWNEMQSSIWTIQINSSHWSSLRISERLLKQLPRGNHQQISKHYKVRLLNAYADLPMRLEVELLKCQA